MQFRNECQVGEGEGGEHEDRGADTPASEQYGNFERWCDDEIADK